MGQLEAPRVAEVPAGPKCGYSAGSNVHTNFCSGSQHFTSLLKNLPAITVGQKSGRAPATETRPFGHFGAVGVVWRSDPGKWPALHLVLFAKQPTVAASG